MKQKMIKLLEIAKETLGEDSDIMILFYKDGQCGVSMHGSSDNIAHAVFANIHSPESTSSAALYHIIKQNVLNIVANPSPHAVDLIRALTNVVPEKEQEDEQV